MAKSEERKRYEKEWQDNFKAEHGISYTTYRKRLQMAELIAEYETAGNPGNKGQSKKGNN